VLKFFFVGETCKFQTHEAPPVEVALVLMIQISLNKGFLDFSIKVNVTVITEFFAISEEKSVKIRH